jgi:nucleoprotein TPR
MFFLSFLIQLFISDSPFGYKFWKKVMKLAELHKESSDEWSKKAGELEGVIKALEVMPLLIFNPCIFLSHLWIGDSYACQSLCKQTHLAQVEDDYKEKLEKETLAKIDLEKVYLQILF